LEDKEEESQKYGASSYWDDYGMEKKTMKIWNTHNKITVSTDWGDPFNTNASIEW
jgi:hypothetical protein